MVNISDFIRLRREAEYHQNNPMGIERVKPECLVPYCNFESSKRGFCETHYQRNRIAINEWIKKNGGDLEDLWADLIEDTKKWDEGLSGNPEKSHENTDAEISESLQEAEFEQELIREMRSAGHGVWKLNPAAMPGGGVPDLLIITKDGNVLFRELKTDGGKLKSHQAAFLLNLRKHDYFVGLWRPADWESGKIEKEITKTQGD